MKHPDQWWDGGRYDACVAAATVTVHAMRPTHRRDLVRYAVTYPTSQPNDDCVQAVTDAMTTPRRDDDAKYLPWWSASSEDVIAAATVVTDADEATASHLVAASYHALRLARVDVTCDVVLRLVERAASYLAGTIDANRE